MHLDVTVSTAATNGGWAYYRSFHSCVAASTRYIARSARATVRRQLYVAENGCVLSTLISRNVKVFGKKRTSMRLEPTMWSAFEEITEREGETIHSLVTKIDARRGDTSLTSAARVFILTYFIVLSEHIEDILKGLDKHSVPSEHWAAPRIADTVIARVFKHDEG